MYCNKCGAKIEAQSKFCNNCGQIIDANGGSAPMPGKDGLHTLTIKLKEFVSLFFKEIYVVLDGTDVYKIKNGETIQIPVSPGTHAIRFKTKLGYGVPGTVYVSGDTAIGIKYYLSTFKFI